MGDKEKKKTLFHYTNEEGAKGIKDTNVIKQSSRARGDAAFGDGVYFTDRLPSSNKLDIAANNYDNRTNEAYLEQCLRKLIEVTKFR